MDAEPDLTRAYEVLTDAGAPPLDVAARVSARRRQRRCQRSTAGVVALALAVGGAVLATSGRVDDRALAVTTPDAPPSAPEAPGEARPRFVCPPGTDPTASDVDHPGYWSLAELLGAESEERGGFTLDQQGRRLWFLRADGTAHSEMRIDQVDGRWLPVGVQECSDAAGTRTPAATTPLPSLALAGLLACEATGTQHADLATPARAGAVTVSRFLESGDTESTATSVARWPVEELTDDAGRVRVALTGLDARDGRLRVTGIASCGDRLPRLADTGAGRPLVSVALIHCRTEPLEHDGRTWLPPTEDQFGSGGPVPPGFTGLGIAVVSGDRLDFLDLGGADITMYPTNDPRTDLGDQRCA